MTEENSGKPQIVYLFVAHGAQISRHLPYD